MKNREVVPPDTIDRDGTLDSIMTPALMTAGDPAAARFVDDFMWDYMGSAYTSGQLPAIWRQRPDGRYYDYDTSLEKGITETGRLVHARRAMGALALGLPAEHTFFVVTGDMATQEVIEWRVTDVDQSATRADLLLSDAYLDLYPSAIDSWRVIDDPIERELARRASIQHARRPVVDKAQLTLTTQGVWFRPPGAHSDQAEVVGGITQLRHDQERLRRLVAAKAARLEREAEEVKRRKAEGAERETEAPSRYTVTVLTPLHATLEPATAEVQAA